MKRSAHAVVRLVGARSSVAMAALVVLMLSGVSLALAQSGPTPATLATPGHAGATATHAGPRDAQRDLSASAAVRLVRRHAAALLESRPPRAVPSDVLDAHAALATVGGHRTLVESVAPAYVRHGRRWVAADNRLRRRAGGGWQPKAALTPIAIPAGADGTVRIGADLGVGLSGARGVGGVADGAGVIYPNMLADTDAIVSSTGAGVQVSWVLRSGASPATLGLDLGNGHSVKAIAGGYAILQGDRRIGIVGEPTAWDADHRAVPVRLQRAAAGVAVHVTLPADVHYPVVVDPVIDSVGGATQLGTLSWGADTPDLPDRETTPLLDTAQHDACTVFLDSAWVSAGTEVAITRNCHTGITSATGDGAVVRWVAPGSSTISRMDTGTYSQSSTDGAMPQCGYAGIRNGTVETGRYRAIPATGPVSSVDSTNLGCAASNATQRICVSRTCAASTSGYNAYFFVDFDRAAGQISTGRLASVTLYRDDFDSPTVRGPAAGVVTWGAATVPLTLTGTDSGLGIKRLAVYSVSTPLVTVDDPCTGTTANPCPATWNGRSSTRTLSVPTASFAEGIVPVILSTEDVVGNRSVGGPTVRIGVDRSGPTVTEDNAATVTATPIGAGGTAALHVRAAEGNPTGTDAQRRSGVASVVMSVSTGTTTGFVQKASYTPAAGCAADACSVDQTFTIDTTGLSAGDHTVRAVATDAVGNATTRDVTFTVSARPLVATAPAVTGTAADGQTLTGDHGSWNGEPTITYTNQWRRCDIHGAACGDIAGATGETYAVTTADVGSTIVLAVTAANGAGSTTAASTATAVVAEPVPVVTAAPAISGTAKDGEELTATHGTWTSAAPLTYTYAWQRCQADGTACVAIDGATGATYTATPQDTGSTLRVAVTATNVGGAATSTSTVTGVVAAIPPADEDEPTIAGDPYDSVTLTADRGTWAGTAPLTYTYQWLRCDAGGASCVPIDGATDDEYSLVNDDVGATVRVKVTAANAIGSADATSAATAVVIVKDLAAPGLVTGLTATESSAGTTYVSWTPGEDPDLADGSPGTGTASYAYRYEPEATTTWSDWVRTDDDTIELDAGLLAGDRVQVEVASFDADGNGPAIPASNRGDATGATVVGTLTVAVAVCAPVTDDDGPYGSGPGGDPLTGTNDPDVQTTDSFEFTHTLAPDDVEAELPAGATVVSAQQLRDDGTGEVSVASIDMNDDLSLSDNLDIASDFVEQDLDDQQSELTTLAGTAQGADLAAINSQLGSVADQQQALQDDGGVTLSQVSLAHDDDVAAAFATNMGDDLGQMDVSPVPACAEGLAQQSAARQAQRQSQSRTAGDGRGSILLEHDVRPRSYGPPTIRVGTDSRAMVTKHGNPVTYDKVAASWRWGGPGNWSYWYDADRTYDPNDSYKKYNQYRGFELEVGLDQEAAGGPFGTPTWGRGAPPSHNFRVVHNANGIPSVWVANFPCAYPDDYNFDHLDQAYQLTVGSFCRPRNGRKLYRWAHILVPGDSTDQVRPDVTPVHMRDPHNRISTVMTVPIAGQPVRVRGTESDYCTIYRTNQPGACMFTDNLGGLGAQTYTRADGSGTTLATSPSGHTTALFKRSPAARTAANPDPSPDRAPTVTRTVTRLTAQPGTWVPAATSLEYAWCRIPAGQEDGCEPIDGESGSTYTIRPGDLDAKIAVEEWPTGHEEAGSFSEPIRIDVDPRAPENVTPPSVAACDPGWNSPNGCTVDPGTWTQSPTLTYIKDYCTGGALCGPEYTEAKAHWDMHSHSGCWDESWVVTVVARNAYGESTYPVRGTVWWVCDT